MRIVHVHSLNLQLFEDAVSGTGHFVNGSTDPIKLLKSLQEYNARDVVGLVIFRRHLTKNCLRLLQYFDKLFELSPKPIVVVCDEAFALYRSGKLHVNNSPLYLVDSIDGTISNIDLGRIFTTLSFSVGDPYEFSSLERSNENVLRNPEHDTASKTTSLVSELLSLYSNLEKEC